MRNIISAVVSYDDSTNITKMDLLCYESIDAMEDSLVIRLYKGDGIVNDNSSEFLTMVQGDADWTVHSVYFEDDRVFEKVFTATTGLEDINSSHVWLRMAFKRQGYQSTGLFHITFTDFAPTGVLLINQYQRKMLMDLESRYSTGTAYFVCYLSAAVAIPETATAGDGLAVNENNALTVELGDGLEFDEDGKIKLSDGKQVEGIAVTADSSDKVTSVAITYDDESTSTYSVTYDANDRVTSFGGVPITWS